ncbi:MAG: geranylgeranylglycerol-phosphate geranylgeranyltransferase [Candidatus Delongbacteria bacterium]|nr:geranylgeranylglycerol-phosphate geranylgeranyltransferase [Candidatus Delongbacteria bacterium]
MPAKFKAVLSLFRPFNGVLVMVSVLVGAYLAHHQPAVLLESRVWLMAFITCLVTFGANAGNDYFDLEIDRINRPERPLPSNRLRPDSALFLCIFLLLFSLYLASWLGPHITGLVFIAVFISFFYTPFFKRWGIIKNLTIAFNVSLAFICGGIVAGNVHHAFFLSLFGFFISVYRELLKDIFDCDGDRINQVHTIPVKYGIETAWRLSLFSLLCLGFSIFWAYFHENYTLLFLIMETGLVFLPLIAHTLWVYHSGFSLYTVRWGLRLSKLLMMVGLAVFFVN